MSQTYYFLVANQGFLEAEPLNEVLEERVRNYQERDKAVDFEYVVQPAFLEAPSLAAVKAKVMGPAAAVISTDEKLIRWLLLRLAFVETGEFVAPSEEIPAPFGSLG